MKNYQLKWDKWFSSTQSIYSHGMKVGSFIPGLYSSSYRVILGEKEYIIKKKNVFSNNLQIYSGHSLLAEIQNFSFKNESVITTADRTRYILKSNGWNSRYNLSSKEGNLGECHCRMNSSFLSFKDSTDEILIIATIAQTYTTYEIAVLIACFVPLFVVIIT